MGGCFEGWDFGRAAYTTVGFWASCTYKGGILDGSHGGELCLEGGPVRMGASSESKASTESLMIKRVG